MKALLYSVRVIRRDKILLIVDLAWHQRGSYALVVQTECNTNERYIQMKGTYKAVEVSAPDLAKLAIEAHGGLDRWKRFTMLSVHGINGGVLWGAKGKAGVLNDVTITVDLRNERVSHWPFGSPDRRSRFEPQRVALENESGKVLEELRQPRSSFQGHTFETPWSDLQLAYFVGCAMWTYLNTPFLLVRPGVESEEIEPWQEAGKTLRPLKVRFPTVIENHRTEQA